jgi:hypothetical protein
MVLSAVGLVGLAVSASDLSIPPPPGLEFRDPFVNRDGVVVNTNVLPPPGLLFRDPFVDREGNVIPGDVEPPPGLLVRDPFVNREGSVLATDLEPPPGLLFREPFVNREGEVIENFVEPPVPDLPNPFYYDFVLRDGSIDPDFVFPTGIRNPVPSTAVVFGEKVFPNPFNPGAQIQFRLNAGTDVRVAVYDVRGRMVRILVDGPLAADLHVLRWDGRSDDGSLLPSGVYVFRIDAGGTEVSVKASLLK